MSSFEARCRLAGLSLGAGLLLAPLSLGFQRPPPVPFGTHEVPAQVGCLGYGKGELALPRMGQDGRLSGWLVDNDTGQQFRLEAVLTGMMPDGGFGGHEYGFGGVYGKVWKAGGAALPFGTVVAAYDVEGRWEVFAGGKGEFTADALHFSPRGDAYVVGGLFGRFQVSSDGTSGLTATWGGGATKTIPGDWSDAASNPREPKYHDAASAPHKPRIKVLYRDRASVPPDYADAASAPHKPRIKVVYADRASNPTKQLKPAFAAHPTAIKSPYHDAGSQEPVQQVGGFCLRFHFDE